MCARGRSERTRHEQRRKEKPVVLIVCEGETEELYFKDIKRRFRARWIEVSNPHCNNPVRLVRQARQLRKKMQAQGLKVEAWVVFDAESRMEEEARGYAKAIAEAEKAGVQVANSSPSFEYWILLHYAAGIVVVEPSEAERELKKSARIPGFSKPNLPYGNLWDIYKAGTPSRAAVNRRNALSGDGENPRFGRPVTYVDLLVDKMAEINNS